jgi:hypothetical protein
MEIKDNQFSRQFETSVDGKMLSVEYSIQERKLFLTKINIPEANTFGPAEAYPGNSGRKTPESGTNAP